MPKAKRKSQSSNQSTSKINQKKKASVSQESDTQSGPTPSTSTRSSRNKSSARDSRVRASRSMNTASSTDTNERENRSRTRKHTIGARSVKNWKPLRESTKKYALQVFDESARLLVSRSSNHVIGDVQAHLNDFRRSFKGKLDRASGPVSNISNYNNIGKLMNDLDVDSYVRLQASVEKKIQEKTRDCEMIEEEMESLKRFTSGASTFHPFLQTLTPNS